jgi:hypothetical protein
LLIPAVNAPVKQETASTRMAWLVPIVFAVIAAGFTAAAGSSPLGANDFDYLWLASRFLREGRDPYASITAAGMPFQLYYPLPAVLLALPLGLLPFETARLAFAAAAGFTLGLAGMRRGPAMLAALASAPAIIAFTEGQWSPILVAGAVVPWLGAFWVVKPSIGLALFAGYPTRQAALGGAMLILISLAVMPSWPSAWLGVIRGSTHFVPPVLRPGGALLLLALLRWRLPEGRLLAALACVPQTVTLYESLPLFLIARTGRQGALLVGLSITTWALQIAIDPPVPGLTLEASLARRWPVLLVLVYLPALVMLLRHPSRRSVLTETRTG